MGSDLNRHLNDEPVVARPPTASYRIAKFVRKHRGAVAAGLAVVSALSIALALTTVSYVQAEDARRALREESYIANLTAADLRLRSLETLEARRLLAAPAADLRGWEWRHLFAKSDVSLGMLSSGGGAPVVVGASPDGDRIFWLTQSSVLRIADAVTLTSLPDLTRPDLKRPAEMPPEYIIGVSPDGTRYASVAWVYAATANRQEGDTSHLQVFHRPMTPEEKNTVLVRQTSTGRILARLPSPVQTEWIWQGRAEVAQKIARGVRVGGAGAVFSRDGAYVAMWSHDHVIRLYDIAAGREIGQLRGHQEEISSVEFSPDSSRLLSASYDRTMRLWNLETRTVQRVLDGHGGAVWSVAFSSDGQRIASGDSDRVIRVWDLNGIVKNTFRGHTKGIEAMAFSPDGARLASAGDRSVRIWGLDGDVPATVLTGHTQEVTSVAFTHDGRRIISGAADHTVRVWNPARAASSVIADVGPSVQRVVFSPDGQRLAAVNDDRLVRIWDRQKAFGVTTLKGHSAEPSELAFSADGSKLVSISSRDVRTWDSSTGELLMSSVWPKPLWLVATLPEGRQVVEMTDDGGVRIWNTSTQEGTTMSPSFSRRFPIFAVAVSSWNQEMLAVCHNRQLSVWEMARGTRLLNVEGLDVLCSGLTFSPDGTRLASAHGDGRIKNMGRTHRPPPA